MTRLACFDLDGTLTDRDCFVRFLRAEFGLRRVTARFSRMLVSPRTWRNRDHAKAFMCELFRGRDSATVEAHAREFGAYVVQHWLRDATMKSLEHHRQQGDHILIVSASLAPYVAAIAELLGVQYVATELSVMSGCYTGGIEGGNCRGIEKVHRASAFLKTLNIHRSDIELHAYGDSAGDSALLEWADYSHWVGKR